MPKATVVVVPWTTSRSSSCTPTTRMLWTRVWAIALPQRSRLTRMGSQSGGRHFTANLVITPTSEGADGSCYLLLFNARNVPATITETAIYQDNLVKTPEGWRFKKRVVWRDDDDMSPFKPTPRTQ
jgi:hypothetical protein